MAISHVLKRHKWKVSILLSITFIIGGLMMFEYFNLTKEERRNRDYEVSLVNALKNSYEGIEKIRITDPDYLEIPGDWICNVELEFKDGKILKYGVGYSIKYKKLSDASLEWENRIEDRSYLNMHKGKTEHRIRIIYSNQEEVEQ